MAKYKERSPAFQMYPRKFAGDEQVMAMDLDVVGAHILLMCAAAASPEAYRIDADERAIRMRLRNPSEADWQRVKAQLLKGAWKLSPDGKWWEQDGLRRTFEKQRAFSEAQRLRANSRWGNNDAEVMPDAYRNDAESVPKTCSSSSPNGVNHVASTPKKDDPTEAGMKLAILLRERILKNNPKHKPVEQRQLEQWAHEADLMMRVDKRTEEEIVSLIEWSQQDSFERCNILSMAKLRKRFDELALKSKRNTGTQPGKNGVLGITANYVPASQRIREQMAREASR